MTVSTEYYDKLGVSPDATQAEIKKAYRKKARSLHPDSNPGDKAKEEEFKQVSIVYNILSDSDARRRYDTNGTTESVSNSDRQEALGIVMQAVAAELSKPGDWIFQTALFEKIKKDLKQKGKTELDTIKNIKRQAKRIEKLLTKITHRDGENSFLHQALTAEKNKLILMVAQQKVKIKVLKMARLIVAEYQFSPDAPDIQKTFMQVAQSRGYNSLFGNYTTGT